MSETYTRESLKTKTITLTHSAMSSLEEYGGMDFGNIDYEDMKYRIEDVLDDAVVSFCEGGSQSTPNAILLPKCVSPVSKQVFCIQVTRDFLGTHEDMIFVGVENSNDPDGYAVPVAWTTHKYRKERANLSRMTNYNKPNNDDDGELNKLKMEVKEKEEINNRLVEAVKNLRDKLSRRAEDAVESKFNIQRNTTHILLCRGIVSTFSDIEDARREVEGLLNRGEAGSEDITIFARRKPTVEVSVKFN